MRVIPSLLWNSFFSFHNNLKVDMLTNKDFFTISQPIHLPQPLKILTSHLHIIFKVTLWLILVNFAIHFVLNIDVVIIITTNSIHSSKWSVWPFAVLEYHYILHLSQKNNSCLLYFYFSKVDSRFIQTIRILLEVFKSITYLYV